MVAFSSKVVFEVKAENTIALRQNNFVECNRWCGAINENDYNILFHK